MSDYLSKVAEFMLTFKQPVLPTPTIPSVDRCNLRVKLIQEELDELSAAIAANDIVAVADAFADLQYVLSGAVLEFGLGGKFNELFDEIQRSNMSKACNSYDEAMDTADFHAAEHGLCYIVPDEATGKFLVYRESDKKVMKSKYYSPANLEPILK
jgi:predicted HAD superfamily Cof-like phosphohydrolase